MTSFKWPVQKCADARSRKPVEEAYYFVRRTNAGVAATKQMRVLGQARK